MEIIQKNKISESLRDDKIKIPLAAKQFYKNDLIFIDMGRCIESQSWRLCRRFHTTMHLRKALKSTGLFGYNLAMLARLYISNIVLIEKLNLEFGAGLNVLTGETGAGKSILLGALALALGARSDVGLIRHGRESAQVVAEFEGVNDNMKILFDENGIDYDGGHLVLRRALAADGKSRAWINDVPASIKTLKQIGDHLVEIHGQFENHSLLDQTTHRKTLDEFAARNNRQHAELLSSVGRAYTELHLAEKKLRELEDMLARAAAERDFLEHNISELKSLNPQPGEEEELANRRSILMSAEKNAAILADAAEAISPKGQPLDSQIFSAAHILERIKTEPNPYQEQIDRLYEAAGAISEISEKLAPIDTDADALEGIEERLFAIRAAARKHRAPANGLHKKLEQMIEQLNAIDNSDAELKKTKAQAKAKKTEFDAFAAQLTHARIAAGNILRQRILSELPDLKLGQADFMIERAQASPSSSGSDEITFFIKTNPGSPFAPLHKTASGGELARLMLALRVVFGDGGNDARTFVFDEVDTGISGATAGAVGERLARLAGNGQALVITHSAQVAGYADKHFKIEKFVKNDSTTTTVHEVTEDMRANEIARIISGAEITPESIATAKTLIKQRARECKNTKS
jgi:DNA repair protein RecN (Recombination protein N)